MKIIERLTCKKSTGKNDDTFIGFKIKQDTIDFYFPVAYKYDETSESIREDIIEILRTIYITKTNYNSSFLIDSDIKEEQLPILSYIWIINDYLKNGISKTSSTECKTNQKGKINWKKTIENKPLFTKSGMFYKNIYVDKKTYSDYEITNIHKYCLKISLDFIGWLYNIKSYELETFNFSNIKIYEIKLEKELTKTFDDLKKTRLLHMLNIVRCKSSFEDGDIVYGVDNYYYVFEKMVDTLFSNKKVTNSLMPNGDWHLKFDNYALHKSSNLIPDTFFENQTRTFKDLYIIDSKYYTFGIDKNVPNSLPQTSSIQKQFTYAEYIHQKYNNEYRFIYNIFILPYNKEENLFGYNNNIEYFGYADADWPDKNQSFSKIYSFFIDLKYLIHCYNHKVFDDYDKNTIIETINKITTIK